MTVTNCTFIGENAGADMVDGEGIVIIGDNIRKVADGQKFTIGETVFGVRCNLYDILLEKGFAKI